MRLVLSTCILLALFAGDSRSESAYETFPMLAGPYLGQETPGDTMTPFAPGILNPPDGFHSSAVFSPDGTEVLWTAMGKHTFISRQVDGVWSRPKPIDIDTAYGIGEAFYSADGNRLFFIYRKPPPDDPVDRERIWFVDRTDTGWTEPKSIDPVVRAHPTHWQFSLAANGNLYFTSEIEGVRGGQDIYMAAWLGDHYADPVDLGPVVNSNYGDFCPFIAPDESYLLFARSVPEENNRSDLFVSFRDESGVWGEAINLGDEINSLHNEVCPVVTPDGRYLIYLSLSGGINQLYWISTGFLGELKSASAAAGR